MSRESHKPHLPLLLRFSQRLGRAAGPNEQFRIVLEHDTVNLPQIQMIRLQPRQRLLEHLHRQAAIAPMRADLRHQKNLVALPLQRRAHPSFGFSAVIFPAVIEKGHASIDRPMHNVDRGFLVRCLADVMPTQPQRRNFHIRMFPKRPQRNRGGRIWHTHPSVLLDASAWLRGSHCATVISPRLHTGTAALSQWLTSVIAPTSFSQLPAPGSFEFPPGM